MKFPIDSDEKMANLKQAISIQNIKAKNLKNKVDFYKIKDPIYENYHIQIFANSRSQIQTKIVADHFYNVEYITLLNRNEYGKIKNNLIGSLIICCIVLSFFTLILGVTFRYLEVKSLSLIPLFSLIVITVALVLLIINIIRLNVINKVISGEYMIDQKYIYLYLYKIKKMEHDLAEKEGLGYECGKLAEECRKDQ